MPKIEAHPMCECIVCHETKRHRALGKCWDCYHRDYSRIWMRNWREKQREKQRAGRTRRQRKTASK